MLFNSWQYALFLPLVVVLHAVVGKQKRWAVLLAASYVFYAAWRPEYLLLIVASTLVDFWAGRTIAAHLRSAKAKWTLAASLGVNLGMLFTFKYADFFSTSTNAALAALGLPPSLPLLDLVLPVGISFYTFQTLSYTIDVYRGLREAETHLGRFALYVAFFPQLVAGPIERSTRLLPELARAETARPARLVDGCRLILWGLFKKTIIGDRLAVYVDVVYAQPHEHNSVQLAVASLFFALQIFCDFSAYSDIAIGSARVLGYDLMINFNRPYWAVSIPDFWRRWHISLSTWFRDYVYIPLGGNRSGRARWFANLIIVFAVSGLWHGANWTFVVWGLLHGAFAVAAVNLGPPLAQALGGVWTSWPGIFVRWLGTMVLVLLAWVFFRASDIETAMTVLEGVARLEGGSVFLPDIFGRTHMLLACAGIVAMEGVHIFSGSADPARFFDRLPSPLRLVAYVALALAVLNLGMVRGSQFIYFQF